MTLALGIDIGGTKTSAGIVDTSGTVVVREDVPTPAAEGADAVLRSAIELARALVARFEPTQKIVAAGIGAAGVIDPFKRVVVSATSTLPGWAGTQLGAEVEDALGVPVAVQNDVHSHALGEARFGAGHGYRTVVVVAAGTGIGGALVIDGKVQLGAGFGAGHYGHLPSVEAEGLQCTCGRTGHLEMIAAGPAVCAAYRREGGVGSVSDARDVFALAAGGDEIASRSVVSAGGSLGRAIGGLINALDPNVVVVGGGLADAGESWWLPLRAGVDSQTMPSTAGCLILPAALGSAAAIVGAASAAFDLVGRTDDGTAA